ncbi:MAG: Panacea domain-containing protein [Bryobacteraceae bacterium]|jgi:hypothetical protein
MSATPNQARPPFDPSKLHFEFSIPDRSHRFAELILYIADRCESDPTFSAVKLNKILFYSDFEAFARLGVPITGVAYQKLPQGPAAKAMKRVLTEMEQEHLIRVVPDKVHGYARDRVVPIRPPAPGIFPTEQIDIVEKYVRRFWNMTAKAVSEYSHGMAWKLAELNELIPYEAVFISDDPVTNEDVAHARELAARYGWKF